MIFYGCRAKKEYVHTTSVDTLKVTKIIKVMPRQLNSIVIDEVCDSLGNLKPFKYTFGTGKNKTVLKAVNNTLYLEQNLDSIKQVWEKEFKSSATTEKERVEIPVTPKWAWKVLIYAILCTIWIFKKPLLKLIKPL